MYLKRIEIQGFKSFPDRVSLEFGRGITSVVGPNGSGKSNISDAIRWVLGEQSVKSLRGSKMEDVIFSGTDNRKPMGFAEVTLVIDNTDHTLPVDYSEVTVSRRVFRSGESEYQINKVNCRLKDVYELFMDTGIGKDAYSVIGQGKIDEILSSRPEERRAIFEEASGIMKYKVKKEESERKLELTRMNLLRINDIISELAIQLEPLREQAETAKKYLALREQLKEIEVNLFIESMDKLRGRLDELVRQMESVEDNLQKEEEDRKESLDRIEILSASIREKRAKLEELKQAVMEMDVEVERFNSEIKISTEKIEACTQNISRLDSEIGELEGKALAQADENRKRIDSLNELEAEVKKNEEKLEKYRVEAAGLESVIGEGEKKLEQLNNSIFEHMNNVSELKNKAVSTESVINSIKKRQQDITRENGLLAAEESELSEKVSLLEAELKKISGIIANFRSRMEETAKEREKEEETLIELNKKIQSAKTELQHCISRHSLLVDMEKKFEGYSRSVREIMLLCEKSEKSGSGIHGTLAQLISVDKEYETAVEVALGGALQNIVTSTEEDAKRMIEHLKKNRLGRATFLPISSIKCRERFDESAVENMPGYVSVASKVVRCDPKYRDIIDSLIGKVVIAKDLDSGISIARKFNYRFRVVTIEGEVLNTSGALTGGSMEGKDCGLLGRSREASGLQKSIAKIKKQIEDMEAEAAVITGNMKHKDETIEGVNEDIRQGELVKIKLEGELKQLDDELAKVRKRMELYLIEDKQLEEKKVRTEEEYGRLLEEVQREEEEIKVMRDAVNKEQEKSKTGRQQRDSISAGITETMVALNSLLENAKNIKENIERVESEIAAMNELVVNKREEKARNIKDIENHKAYIQEMEKRIESISASKAGSLDEEQKIHAFLEKDEALVEEVNARIKDAEAGILMLREEKNRLEIRRAKAEIEIENIQNRMWDEYEITYSLAEKYRKNIGSTAQAQKRANEIKEEIKQLGAVNVAAIDDYVKTKERYEFLSAQRDDLESTEEKLKRIIGEITHVMKKQFSEQFKLINESFDTVFKELFGGGRAELRLEDSENVLESGIEIEVQPPGKRLQNMLLLSGGERAFTAIALLFAILRLRPAPFCVLDEIEAALDEANVHRFSQYLKKYSQNTQFIMITHRRNTMEISDVLYGVTMQERGVSNLVSLDMRENAS